MKTILFFTFLCPLWIFSQGLNYEQDFNNSFNQYPVDLSIQNQYTYYLHTKEASLTKSSYLTKIDTNGINHWQKQISPFNFDISEAAFLEHTNNGYLYVAGTSNMACDIGYCKSFIQKMDALGDTIWTTPLEDQNCNHASSVKSFGAVIQNQSIYYGIEENNATHIYKTNSNSGQIEDTLIVQETDIMGYGYLSNHELVIYTSGSISCYDNTLTLSNAVALPNIKKVTFRNDTAFVLTNDQIRLYDHNLSLLNTLSVPNNSQNIKLHHDTISVINHDNGFVKLSGYNLQLQPILTDSIHHPDPIHFTSFNLQHISFAAPYNLTQYYSVRINDYTWSNSQNNNFNTSDIGIIDFELDSTHIFQNPNYPNAHYFYKIYLKALVKNFGSKPVDSLFITHIDQYYYCSPDFIYHQKFNTLNLQPNDSTWVNMGLAKFGQGDFQGSQIAIDYCAYTSHPNGVVDTNATNDLLCKNFILGYTGQKEFNPKKALKIYPNPVSESIFVENFNGTPTYQIYNIQGQLLMAGPVSNGTINCTTLNKGIYIIKIQDQENTARTQQFVKY